MKIISIKNTILINDNIAVTRLEDFNELNLSKMDNVIFYEYNKDKREEYISLIENNKNINFHFFNVPTDFPYKRHGLKESFSIGDISFKHMFVRRDNKGSFVVSDKERTILITHTDIHTQDNKILNDIKDKVESVFTILG